MNRTRSKQIVIRLSESEHDAVKRKIELSGVNQQKYLVGAAMNKNIVNTEGIRDIMPELKRIGNNLNQIARKCNEGRPIDDDTLRATVIIGKELSETWRWLRQLAHGRVSDGL